MNAKDGLDGHYPVFDSGNLSILRSIRILNTDWPLLS